MATNYAIKYAPKVAERFKKASITDAAAGKEFSFIGAKTLVVSSIDTVPLNDFNRNAASNRFGAIANLGDTKQEMQMNEDKSFGFAIDAGDNSDQAIDKAAGAALRREIDEVIIPHLDKFRLGKWAAGAGTKETGDELTTENILGAIITVGGAMSNGLVPEEGRSLYIPIRNYVKLVQAKAIVNIHGDMGQQAVEKGVVGQIDRNKVIPVPDGWFPEGIEFLIKHKSSTVDPVKLQNYHIRKDAQGFDGPVVEGRVYFDSFVLEAKKQGVATYTVA